MRESPVNPASRLFMSCYWIFTITIIATYSGNLVAFMTVKKLKFPIDNLEELAAHSEYQAGVLKGASTMALFKARLQCLCLCQVTTVIIVDVII